MHFDNTRIYTRSLELIDLARHVMAAMPQGYGFLKDQLRRAASSVVLNFAEGYGRESHAELRRYFIIARGSASEVAAILDVARCFGIIDQALHERGRDLCDHIARMLTKFRRPGQAA